MDKETWVEKRKAINSHPAAKAIVLDPEKSGPALKAIVQTWETAVDDFEILEVQIENLQKKLQSLKDQVKMKEGRLVGIEDCLISLADLVDKKEEKAKHEKHSSS